MNGTQRVAHMGLHFSPSESQVHHCAGSQSPEHTEAVLLSWQLGREEQGVAAVLQQQDQAPFAAPAAGSMLSQVARARLLLLSGMELLVQPSWTHWRSEAVGLDVASSLCLLRGWKVSVQLLSLVRSPSSSFLGIEQV